MMIVVVVVAVVVVVMLIMRIAKNGIEDISKHNRSIEGPSVPRELERRASACLIEL